MFKNRRNPFSTRNIMAICSEQQLCTMSYVTMSYVSPDKKVKLFDCRIKIDRIMLINSDFEGLNIPVGEDPRKRHCLRTRINL